MRYLYCTVCTWLKYYKQLGVFTLSWPVGVHLVRLHATEGVVDNPMVSLICPDGQDDVTHHCTILGREGGKEGEREGGRKGITRCTYL